MNIALWVLQAVLALLNFSGGAYKLSSFDEVAKQMSEVPRGVWSALGVIEILGALLLIAPSLTRWKPGLTPLAAAVLALEGLGLAVLYARYSTALAASNPMPWAIVMALLAAFVAYGRYKLAPITRG
jgi:hypothetical protein